MTEPLSPRWRKHSFPWERIIPLSFPLIAALIIIFLFSIPIPYARAPIPTSPAVPSAPATPISPVNERQEDIKAAFDFAWNGYYKLAFPHDELKPVSNTPGTSRNDWGATAVDALGTAILMGKKDIVKIVLEQIAKTDFTHTTTPISVFESTIRYVGGLLSAYELLSGPFQDLVPVGFDVKLLVEQARSLADLLANAFVEGQKLPSGILDPTTLKGNGKNTLAGAGSLVC
jgi:mannosyl-oligosaccharide alpha-1,2-mannosidase